MADLIQNVQEVYKKWESRSAPNFSQRGRRREGQYDTTGRRSYGISRFENYDQPGNRRYKQRSRTPYFKLPKYDGLAQFKMAPSVTAENKPRPFMGTCCHCLPLSKAAITDKSIFSLSICNVLYIPHFQRLDFNLVLSILKKNKQFSYPDVSQSVLKSNRIVREVESAVKYSKMRSELNNDFEINNDTLTAFKNVHYDKVKHILDSLKTSVSSVCLQFSGLLLRYLLGRVFDGILVHKGQIELLKATSQENVPIIYLPVHRSHLDYILVSFILFMNSLKVPLVIIAEDLHIPFLGYFIRYLGAIYFKKKKMEYELCYKVSTERTVLKSYLMECLKAGHNIEGFIEEKRSRSGKPQIPKSDLLSMVVQAYMEGAIEDAYISPVSVSYEKLIEVDYISEQLGQPKRKGNLFSSLYSIWKMLHCNFGSVRLNFNQPFSLKEFVEKYKSKFPVSNEDNQYSSSDESSAESSSSEESSSACTKFCKNQFRHVVKDLARHVVHDSTSSTALMSTQLVAFLFITQYRKGATQQQLQNSLDWLRMELLSKKRDTGFTGESLPVIKRAVDLLGKHLISSEIIDMEWTSSDLENNNVKVTIYKPLTKLPHVLELQYYANSVTPVFLLDSMIVNAVYALVDVEICHFRHCDSKLYVLRDKLINKAVALSDMLQFEFIAVPPCADIAISFNEVLDGLIEKEYLHVVGMGVISTREQYNRRPHPLSFEESNEDEDPSHVSVIKEQQLKIDLTEESINHLEFLRNILSPYIESYWIAATTLLKLVDEVQEENAFIQDMQLTAQEKLYKGLLAYEESFSADTFKNALKLFERWHVIDSYLQDGIKAVYLSDSYNSKEKVNDIIAQIEEFRK